MLTDDDLTRELGAAFRSAAKGLHYTGRTRPPRRAAPALTATVAVAAAGAVAAGVISTAGHSRPAPRPGAAGSPRAGSAPATAQPSAAPSLVTENFGLAGFRITYQRRAGAPNPVVAERVKGGLPAGVREVHLTGTRARAWVGQAPGTTDNALYVRAPHGPLFVLLSATWTQKQLIRLVMHPTPVPLVSPSHGGSQT